jgi:hypothetical protein
MSTLDLIHFVCGLIVLAEALNKLERTAPLAPNLSRHDRIVAWLKALAWLCLALGAGGAVIAPMMPAMGTHMPHTLIRVADDAVMLGFAILIIRTRVKEG